MTALRGSSSSPLIDRIFAPIDITALVYFRITFGFLMVWELGRYLINRHVESLWVQPEFHFNYLGFGWVDAPPGDWPYVLVAAVMVAAFGMAIGWFYRLCAALFFFGFTWLFLIDQAKYMNHFYLICLLGFLAVLIPANRCFSVDAWRRPALRSNVCPAWTLWLLRAQVAVVYFYGGIAKLNADWLRGEPIRSWLKQRVEGPDSWQASEPIVYFLCYGGLLFDLLIVPLLLCRRTRPLAVVLVLGFHLTNHSLFDIGVFPWLGIALTVLFFPPDSPRRAMDWLQSQLSSSPHRIAVRKTTHSPTTSRQRGAVLAFLAAYLSIQLLVPLRHLLYPGNVSWTEEGHAFAWHMMLRSKDSDALFVIRDGKETWLVDPLQWLTRRQYRKMAGRPEMIVQFAHHLADQMRQQGYTEVQVHAVVRTRLNGRPPALLIDPGTDLAKVRRGLRPARWILRMENDHPVPEWARSLI